MKVCYPGTFDPITKGHLDIIERASKAFDQVVVLIMRNPRKRCLFSEEERVKQIEKCIQSAGLKNVEVKVGEGLTVQYARKIGADAMIRGIRAVSDYEYELQIATANMELDEEIETIFLIARPAYSFLSSSVVKEIGENGGEINDFMPEIIVDEVLEKLRKKEG